MSILRSLNTGAAGLRAHSNALGVASDNIANVNTVGFKKSRANFQDVLGRPASAPTPTPGAGSTVGSIQQLWSQGSLLTTDSPTDLALSGEGFFLVSGTVSGTSGQFYTRAGQFNLDETGTLVNADNMRLQGYLSQNGVLGSTVQDLTISGNTLPAIQTTTVDMAANLDSNSVTPAAFDPLNASTTSNFSTTVNVYDSLGNSHETTVFFRNTGANAWDWHALVDGGEIAGGTAGTPTQIENGSLTFTTAGALDTETSAGNTVDFVGATAGQAIAFDFGSSITTDGGTGLDGSTQFAAASTTNGLSQDGNAAGSVAGITVDSDGTINGVFTNGNMQVLGQLAIASFPSNDGLERAGSGLWIETSESGPPLVGTAESGGRGSVMAGTLEQSNVDLGKEFVNLIAYQRGFQANSRIITTSDEMYSELVNLKR